MIDPVTIIKATRDLVDLSFNVANFIQNLRNVDATIRLLQSEVEHLAKVLGFINTILTEKISTGFSTAATVKTQQDDEYWTLVSHSMGDCKETLESLRSVLENINIRHEGNQSFRQTRMQIGLSLRAGSISEYRQRITAFTSTLQIVLQLITMYVPLGQILLQFFDDSQWNYK